MTTTTPTTTPIVRLEGAAFGYGDHAVVSGVDLTVSAGEVVAVLGPNGSGKSTLVRGLLGLNDQVAGRALLFGVPRDDFTQHSRIGYVPQRHTLSSSVRATVREVVAAGRLSHHRWWAPVLRTAHETAVVDRAVELVGLSDRPGADVTTLSGGQQRRVLIARALASEPDVLIMDEPTAGVDVANQRVLADVMARLAAAGTTMVVVTHELAALAEVVTRVVVVDGGRVRFDGPLQEYAAGRHERHDGHHDDSHDHPPTRAFTPSAGPVDPRGGDLP
ncbi:MAG TPA: metal ABC transporter ATP-binding protein [Pedococcus sp.]|nr:metal ABC transporter ATP-binding protein [Pedococcus sp.]